MFDRLKSERDASQILLVLRRRWPIIIALAVIAAGAAYELAKRQPEKFTATADVLFATSPDSQLIFGVTVTPPDTATQSATNQSLLQLPGVADATAAALHLPKSVVRTAVTFGTSASSNVVSVIANASGPILAATIANGYVHTFIGLRQSAQQTLLTHAQHTVSTAYNAIPAAFRNGTVASGLQGTALKLSLLASLSNGDAQAVQTATAPSSPSSPKPIPDGVLGLILGLLVGGGLAFMLERRDRSIKSAEEAAALYGLPVIGEIPARAKLATGAVGTVAEQEAFHLLRAQLRYFNVDRQVKRVLVTSAEGGEGKSFVALNLARAAVRTDGKRALLIEADLRRPALGRILGLSGMAGLAELLSQSHDLALGLRELVVPLDSMDAEAFRTPRCDLLLAGATPPNPVELLESKGMAELLGYAASIYDVVIVDTTPIGLISDAISLVHQVDGVVIVTRLGHSGRDNASRLMTQLRELNAHILGLVINGSQASASYFGYGGRGRDEMGAADRAARRSRPERSERSERSERPERTERSGSKR
jgi:capsular exopolysaccharide synthesis family protein